MNALLARAEAALDDLMVGLSIPRPALRLLPGGAEWTTTFAVADGRIWLSQRCAALSDAALRALLAHEIGHHLIAACGGRYGDEEGATAAGLALLADDAAWRALLAEARKAA